MTLQELGQKVKTKYPQYQEMNDIEVAQRVIKKYPQYANQIKDSVQEEPKKEGFLKGFAKAIAEPFVKTAVSGISAAKGVYETGKYGFNYLTGNEEEKKEATQKYVKEGQKILKGVDVPFYGKVKPPSGVKEAVGIGAEVGSSFFGGGTAKTAYTGLKTAGKAGLKTVVKESIKRGAITGGVAGAGIELQDKNATAGSVARSAAVGAGTGALLDGILNLRKGYKVLKAPQKAQKIKEKAIQYYKKGLGATKEKYKEQADKVIPELLDKKIWGTQKGLLKKAEKGIELSKEDYEKLGRLEGLVSIKGIQDKIDEMKLSYKRPDGSVMSINKTRYRALESLEADINSLNVYKKITNLEPQAYKQELRELAEAYGADLYGTRKAQKTIEDNKTLSQIKEIDSAIRSLLAKEEPEYATINKLFSSNQKLKSIVEETMQRKSSHSWISLRDIAFGIAGGGAGFSGGLDGALAFTAIGVGFSKIINSTWFNTMKAVKKQKLAEKLLRMSDEEMGEALFLLSNQGIRAVNRILGKE